jgi:hypothetical protein
MVFGTSFVARPSFWREWLRWCESLASHCEAAAAPLQHMLTAGGSPPGHQPMQQMLAERLASLILAVQPHWRCEAANPYLHQRWPTDQLRRDPTDAIVSDAKHAWRQTGWAGMCRLGGAPAHAGRQS